jgi:BirA family transcriptional regulator, biotin operon repressor / biotin---[acetyl-CoA-carboxylase] ligase
VPVFGAAWLANVAGMDDGIGDRGALRPRELRERVLRAGGLWSDVEVVAETGSTNEDLIAAARDGAGEGRVLVAERQTKGRGRQGRRWQSEPGAALTFSVLLRPARVPQSARGWLPLLAGVAVTAGIRAQTGLDVSLKWPNDVLAGPPEREPEGSVSWPEPLAGKLAGILAEQTGDAIVVGTGLNVAASPDDLPQAAATSLAELGAPGVDREELLAAILRAFEHWYRRWADGVVPGDAVASGLRAEYLRECATIGKHVRVELPGGATVSGRACDIDGAGRLLVAEGDAVEPVSAGDVVHVR